MRNAKGRRQRKVEGKRAEKDLREMSRERTEGGSESEGVSQPDNVKSFRF